MLKELHVKNFALIEEVRVLFEGGFSVISGETGAGKSLLVEALELLSGGRASQEMIRKGEEEAVIEALFDISQNNEVKIKLTDMGVVDVDMGDELLLRRHLSVQGRTRIYANGLLLTLSQLPPLTSCLIDLSGQYDQQSLLHEENHRSLLDSSHGITQILDDYDKIYGNYSVIKEEFLNLKDLQNQKNQNIDFLRFQLNEIKGGCLGEDDEEEKLLDEKGRVKNLNFLFDLSKEGKELLENEEDGMVNRLERYIPKLQKGVFLDSSLQNVFQLLSGAHDSLREVLHQLDVYLETLLVSPERLDEIESRLYQIHLLKKKYGASITAIKARGKELEEELGKMENFDEHLAKKEEELTLCEKKVLDLARSLSESRKVRAKELEKQIEAELAGLSMPGVVFKIKVESPSVILASHCGPFGMDEISFEMAPNRGEGLRPLKKIASGGELSRILLAIKQVLANPCPITYVFDEIDAGIGGAEADRIGQKLKALGLKNQVLCVTHLPQVASHAKIHYLIEKEIGGLRTKTVVKSLSADERELEIARMLGGSTMTRKGKEHAREMLHQARSCG